MQDLDSMGIWLALSCISGIGPSTLQKTCAHFHCELPNLLSIPIADLVSVGWSKAQCLQLQPDKKQIEKVKRWLDGSVNRYVVTTNCEEYPRLLKAIDSPPLLLFCEGNLALLNSLQLAVVGSRSPSRSAISNTQLLVTQLCHSDITITSGMALGIDGMAHQSALAARANTIGVLGCGIDIVYPKRHSALFQQVRDKGLLVSEFLLGEHPKPYYFPRRNRIISGLSSGVLVIEASIKSGTLITAKLALDQGRDVFAVPGNVQMPETKGCHFLIKQGAKLTESVNDIFDELPEFHERIQAGPYQNTKKNNQSLAMTRFLDSVDFNVTTVDVIAQRNNMSIMEVLPTLLNYEMRGYITATQGGYIKLRD